MTLPRFAKIIFLATLAANLSSPAYPQDVALSVEEISRLLRNGEWLELRNRMDNAILLGTPNQLSYTVRGIAKLGLLDADSAIADLKVGAESNSTLPSPWISLGRGYRMTGKYDLAITAFKRALEIESENAFALTALWEVYDYVGYDSLIPEVRENLQKSNRAMFNLVSTYTNGSSAWKVRPDSDQNSNSKKISNRTQIKQLDPATARMISIGTAEWEAGQLARASDTLSPVVKSLNENYGRYHPDTARATDILFLALAEQLQIEKALSLMSLARRLDEVAELARENLTRREARFGAQSYEATVAQLALALIQYENGDFNDALRNAVASRNRDQFLSSSTSRPALRLWLDLMFCLVLEQRGQTDEA